MGEYKSSTLDGVFNALCDPTRRAILARLTDSDARVTDIAGDFPISLNSISKHIRMLNAPAAAPLDRGTRALAHAQCRATRGGTSLDREISFLGGRPAALDTYVTRKKRNRNECRPRLRRRGGTPHDCGFRRRSVRCLARSSRWHSGCGPHHSKHGGARGTARWWQLRNHQRQRRDRSFTRECRTIDRPRRLAFTWITASTENRETLVTVDFVRLGQRTEVVVTHEQLPESARPSHHKGWTSGLEHLDEACQKGLIS
jgi:hypothetical protein